MAEESAELEQYERDTNLGKPTELETDQVLIEETKDDVSMNANLIEKMKEEAKKGRYNPENDKAFLVEEHDLLLQYVAGTEALQVYREKMDIKTDIKRLTQLYLEANTKFKLSMPSQNVENLLYEKIVWNLQQQLQQASTAESMRSSTSSLKSSALLGSVQTDKSQSKSSSSLMDSSSSFHQSSSILSSNVSNRNSSTAKNPLAMQQVTIRTQEKKIEQCTPYIVRMDLPADDPERQVWQDLVDELRVNSAVTADILCLILEEGYNQKEKNFDLSHRTMLVNLTQFFFDNIYQDDRLAYSETNLFLRVFLKFSKLAITQEKFGKDDIGQTQFRSEPLRQLIMCLFEGLTRKIPAFNYLRFVYHGPFNRVNMYQMDQDLRRQNQSGQRLDPGLNNSGRPKSDKEKKEEEKKPGFFKSLWTKAFDKNKEAQKNQDLKKPQGPIRDGEMDFDDDKEDKTSISNSSSNAKLFSAMTAVYGGSSDPFGQLTAAQDPSQLKRFEAIEQRIQEERINTHGMVYQDAHFGYKPLQRDRIVMSEDEIRRQFQTRSSQVKEVRAPGGKTVKNLTYYIKSLVQKNFEQMINFQQKIPFAIRAMLRIILIRSRGINDFNQRISVESHEVCLLAQILIGGWLNTGQRNPKCFGIQPTVEKELELEFVFFQAARITFEHVMMMQKIPDEKLVDGFSVFQLNDMIKELAPQVFLFWIRLINIDISEINAIPQESLIQQSIVRVNDLELLYTYCKRSFDSFSKRNDASQPQDQEILARRSSFTAIMVRIDNLAIEIDLNAQESSSFADQIIFESSDDKDRPALVKPNRLFRPLSDHFSNLINLATVPSPHEQFEYYLLFMRKKNDQNLKKKFLEEFKNAKIHIKTITQDFVFRHLMSSETIQTDQKQEQASESHILGPPDDSPQQEIQSPLPQIIQASPPISLRHAQSTSLPQTSSQNQRQMARQSLQFESQKQINSGEVNSKTRLFKLSRIRDDQISMDKVNSMVLNIFNTLKMLIKRKELIFEPLRDHSSSEEMRDLVQLFLSAASANRVSSNPDLLLQAGCQHLASVIKKLNLHYQFDIQNELLKHFCEILQYQQGRFKKISDIFLHSLEQFGNDVYRFEQNITNMKQFHKKFDNQLTFNKTISRYNPEVCLLSHSYELLDDFRYYKGVLLNLSCSNHQTGLPISSYMLFGVVRRSVAGVLEQPIQPPNAQSQQLIQEAVVISEEEFTMKQVRDKRVSRYRDHHMAYTTVTVSLQNNNTMEIKPKDEPIKLIEAFIQFYTNKQKNNLRTLIRADEEKYRFIQPLDLVDVSQCENDKHRYDEISQSEPFDYMNLVHTYIMLLEHISVMSSQNPKDDYIDDRNSKVKQHYDFLRFDLQAKTLRFSIHDYVMRRMHKTIFNQTKPFPRDELVQKLILAKSNDPGWVLTSADSQEKLKRGEKVSDFTEDPEWTNTHIYSSSLKTLLKIIDEETPHLKALYVNEAQQCAIHSLQIASPYKKDNSYDADLQNRVTKHLMIEMCKIYEKAGTNARLYSQLIYIHLFNIPVRENVNWKTLYNYPTYMVTESMPLKEQHQMYLGNLEGRNVAFTMFKIINSLLHEHNAKERDIARNAAQNQPGKKKK